MTRIAHLSDLHFSKFSFSPGQFLSKRWLGNLNLLLTRKRHFSNTRPFSLIDTLQETQVTHVIISGDLTTTSYHQEYVLAQTFVQALKDAGMEVFVIPGNHDKYTKQAERTQTFYQYFPSRFGNTTSEMDQFTLKEHGVTTCPLTKGWRLLLLDTAIATSLISSNGLFSPTIEKNLQHLLTLIPPDEKVLFVNHYPFFQHDEPKRRLLRGKQLEQILSSYPNIQLYLHGHTHRRTIADLRPNHLPIILDSGSTGHTSGSWNLLDLTDSKLDLTVYQWVQKWQPIHTQSFSFDPKPWYAQGLHFKCTGCGKCCTGSGFVWLQEDDITHLSQHLGLSRQDFLKTYTRQVGHDYSLKDHPQTTDCIFLKDKKFCKVYNARPKQCRTFPWWPQNLRTAADWEDVKKQCEGIDHAEAPLVSLEGIKKNLDSN